ncbi:MAG: ankyrin repeat domain-containing protein [Devosia sp.]|nr:ankyrin repeat domain-containing protein [Devosia sp.]
MTNLTEQELRLFEGVNEGDIAKIDVAVDNGAAVNIFGDQYGLYRNVSPLEYAFYSDASVDLIARLIERGAKVGELNDFRKRTIIEIAICFYGDNAVVDVLLRAGAQFPTEQHRCAFEGNIEALRALNATEVGVGRAKSASGCTPLHYAVGSGRLDVVQWLLKEGGAMVCDTDAFGLTALSCAASKGHLEIVKWLLEQGGATITERTRRGLTVLLCAASKGRLGVVQWLLEKGGATIDEKDEEDNTALLFAARGGSLKTVQWLLQHGASLEEKNAQGESAIDLMPGDENKKKLLQLDVRPSEQAGAR